MTNIMLMTGLARTLDPAADTTAFVRLESDFRADVAALIEHLGLPNVHLVGISMGGMVGFQLAVDRPELLRSLTVVNCGPEVKIRTLSDRWQLAKRWSLSRVLSMRAIGKGLGRLLFPRPEQAELRSRIEQRWPENDKRAYLASLDAIIGWSVRERLAAITCPTLVIHGDVDPLVPLACGTDTQRSIPGARMHVIKGMGHALPISMWPSIIDAIAAHAQ